MHLRAYWLELSALGERSSGFTAARRLSGGLPSLECFDGNPFIESDLALLAAESARPGAAIIFRPGHAVGDETGLGTWGPSGRAQFQRVIERLEAVPGRERWLWARRGEAVSDVPSALTYLRGREGRCLLFDPVGMLTPEMLPNAEEHIERSVAELGGHPGVRGYVLCNVDHRGTCVPLHKGVISIDALKRHFSPLMGVLPAVVLGERRESAGDETVESDVSPKQGPNAGVWRADRGRPRCGGSAAPEVGT